MWFGSIVHVISKERQKEREREKGGYGRAAALIYRQAVKVSRIAHSVIILSRYAHHLVVIFPFPMESQLWANGTVETIPVKAFAAGLTLYHLTELKLLTESILVCCCSPQEKKEREEKFKQ